MFHKLLKTDIARVISEICILVEFGTNHWKRGRSGAEYCSLLLLSVKKGPQLVILSLSGQTCDACFTVLDLNVHAVTVPCYLYITNFFHLSVCSPGFISEKPFHFLK